MLQAFLVASRVEGDLPLFSDFQGSTAPLLSGGVSAKFALGVAVAGFLNGDLPNRRGSLANGLKEHAIEIHWRGKLGFNFHSKFILSESYFGKSENRGKLVRIAATSLRKECLLMFHSKVREYYFLFVVDVRICSEGNILQSC